LLLHPRIFITPGKAAIGDINRGYRAFGFRHAGNCAAGKQIVLQRKVLLIQLRRLHVNIYQVIDDMALLTASAQLRSGGMNGSATIDELKAFGADVKWQDKLLVYCYDYCAKVKDDYRQYLNDYGKGLFD